MPAGPSQGRSSGHTRVCAQTGDFRRMERTALSQTFFKSIFDRCRSLHVSPTLVSLSDLFFFFKHFWPCHVACGIFPKLGIEPTFPALEAWSLNHSPVS